MPRLEVIVHRIPCKSPRLFTFARWKAAARVATAGEETEGSMRARRAASSGGREERSTGSARPRPPMSFTPPPPPSPPAAPLPNISSHAASASASPSYSSMPPGVSCGSSSHGAGAAAPLAKSAWEAAQRIHREFGPSSWKNFRSSPFATQLSTVSGVHSQSPEAMSKGGTAPSRPCALSHRSTSAAILFATGTPNAWLSACGSTLRSDAMSYAPISASCFALSCSLNR
mmetsp:Transcript_3306/g.6765  ORF Transcript_3306/g.6765 Transcript_3306/m.6765 type:complete len:229 (+) Transcript_3306:638-1324(+)